MFNKIIFSIITIICFSSTEIKESFAATSIQNNLINAIANVQISGAVKKPGVYKIPSGARLVDLIYKAGGLKKDAVLADINMTIPVSDGSSIYIASKNDNVETKPIVKVAEAAKVTTTINKQEVKTSNKEKKSQKKTKRAVTSSNKSSSLVNINIATEEELNNLPGIGETLAKNIIRYRTKNGRFKDLADLSKVGGIGEKKLKKIKTKATV